MAAIELDRKKINPEIFQRTVKIVDGNGESYFAPRFGVRDADNISNIIIPAEFNLVVVCDEYGFIARKEAYYYAFNSKGVMFVTEALGIESIGRRGVLVFEDARREKSHVVPWNN